MARGDAVTRAVGTPSAASASSSWSAPGLATTPARTRTANSRCRSAASSANGAPVARLSISAVCSTGRPSTSVLVGLRERPAEPRRDVLDRLPPQPLGVHEGAVHVEQDGLERLLGMSRGVGVRGGVGGHAAFSQAVGDQDGTLRQGHGHGGTRAQRGGLVGRQVGLDLGAVGEPDGEAGGGAEEGGGDDPRVRRGPRPSPAPPPAVRARRPRAQAGASPSTGSRCPSTSTVSVRRPGRVCGSSCRRTRRRTRSRAARTARPGPRTVPAVRRASPRPGPPWTGPPPGRASRTGW